MGLLLMVWRLDLLAQSERGLGGLGAICHWGCGGVSGQGWCGGHALDLQGLFVSTGRYLKEWNHNILMCLFDSWTQAIFQQQGKSEQQVLNPHTLKILHAHSIQ